LKLYLKLVFKIRFKIWRYEKDVFVGSYEPGGVGGAGTGGTRWMGGIHHGG
jgi:hypothetical protein